MQATVTVNVPLLLAHYMYIPKIGHTGRGPILSGMGTPGIWLRSNMYCTLVMAASSADRESIVLARLVPR